MAASKIGQLIPFYPILIGSGLILKCLTNEIKFFDWHPVLLSFGWSACVLEGVLAFSGQNFLTRRLSYQNKVRLHWILQTIGTVCTVTGFTVVYIVKNENRKPHFTTWHGFVGVIAVGVACATSIGGAFALYRNSLQAYARPKTVRLAHVVAGVVSLTVSGAALALGVLSDYFHEEYGYYIPKVYATVVTVVYGYTVYQYVKKLKS